MIFHENRLLAEDSHILSVLYFFRKWRKVLQNVSSAAVVIGAIRVKEETVATNRDWAHNQIFT